MTQKEQRKMKRTIRQITNDIVAEAMNSGRYEAELVARLPEQDFTLGRFEALAAVNGLVEERRRLAFRAGL